MPLGLPILVSVIYLASPSTELADAELFRRAVASFESGLARPVLREAESDFREAAGDFAQLIDRGIENPGLYCNLGNAHYLAGDLPEAIFAYRRGLRLAPGHFRLWQCLNLARERVAYPEADFLDRPPVGSVQRFLLRWPPISSLMIECLCAAGGCVSIAQWIFQRRRRDLGFALFCLFLAGIAALPVYQQQCNRLIEENKPVVVISEDGIMVRKGNGLAYPAVHAQALVRGAETRLLYRRGDWLQIELNSGKMGWIPASAALVATPGS